MASFDFDWQRLSRWCFLATVVMLVWLSAPVAKCSWTAFRDTPISDYDAKRINPSDTDGDRIKQDKNFFESLRTATIYCYERTPLLGQEPWKGNLLLGFGGATLVAWLLARVIVQRRR